MHDLKFIRTNPEAFDAGLARRDVPPCAKEILKLDEEKRAIQTHIQNFQTEKNRIAREIGMAKSRGDEEAALELLRKQDVAGSSSEGQEHHLVVVESHLNQILEGLPNLPAEDVPSGINETGNKEIRAWGKKPEFAFKPKEHFEIGEKLGLMNFDEAAKLSGARFVVLKGPLARMERALANFFLDNNIAAGYTEIVPPYLVKSNAMYGTGQLPKFESDLFISGRKALEAEEGGLPIKSIRKITPGKEKRVELDNIFYLIPTAEVPLTNLVGDSILEEDKLPLRMTAYTPCFRSEAGAAGKDTRGMIRQHQFSKVELVSIAHPEKSKEEHERMTVQAESLLQKLGLAYRTMVLCTGDMGFSAEKTYDIEVWLPGQGMYREISSCSNCGAFQARRMKARFKSKNGKGNENVHTLNGSGLPIGRTLVAILENYQQEDGSVVIPEALRPYMGGLEKIA
jgi:seryl-tRNA synthetase